MSRVCRSGGLLARPRITEFDKLGWPYSVISPTLVLAPPKRHLLQSQVRHVVLQHVLRGGQAAHTRIKRASYSSSVSTDCPRCRAPLGDSTGLTAVHVNRTMKLLEGEGLIERRTSRSILIGNWRKLASAGDFDPTYLHLHANERALA